MAFFLGLVVQLSIQLSRWFYSVGRGKSEAVISNCWCKFRGLNRVTSDSFTDETKSFGCTAGTCRPSNRHSASAVENTTSPRL